MILDGIRFRMLFRPGVMILLSVCLLAASRFWDSKRRGKKMVWIGVITMLFFLGEMGYYGFIYAHPQIEVTEGELLGIRHAHGYAMSNTYVMDTGEAFKKTLDLDHFTKKIIMPDDFAIGDTYRLHYEKRTDIIVQAERIDE